MTGFVLRSGNFHIRFRYYTEDAPQTCAAFHTALPMECTMLHARISGAEIWVEHFPDMPVPQENASIWTKPGEVVLGPVSPARLKTAGTMGIYYGEGKGLDACNIFAMVQEEDRSQLEQLGLQIWKKGAMQVILEITE